MALAITAALAGALTPQAVQVVVTGMTPGETYVVTGAWSGGSWAVRGGAGTAAGTQLVLADVLAPINTPVTYTVAHAGDEAASSPVTVNYLPASAVLVTVDGTATAPFRPTLDTVFNEDYAPRATFFVVSGRPDPVGRHDVTPTPSGAWSVYSTGADTAALRDVVNSGSPLVLRTDGVVFGDVAAVQTVVLTGVSSQLVGTEYRVWSLSYQRVADPEPDTVVPIATWDDFDAFYAADEWDDFDTQWSAADWDDLDRFDWAV